MGQPDQTPKTILAVIPETGYQQTIKQILRDHRASNVCYINLEPTSRVTPNNKFFLISAKRKKDHESHFSISLDKDLSELSYAAEEAVKSDAFDTILLDSLSSLIPKNYPNDEAERFTNHLIGLLKASGKMGILACKKTDSDNPVVKTASMAVDAVRLFDQAEKRETIRKKLIMGTAGLVVVFLIGMALFAPPSTTGYVVSETPVATALPLLLLIIGGLSLATGVGLVATQTKQETTSCPVPTDPKMVSTLSKQKFENWRKK